MKRYIPAILLSCCMIVVSGCGGDKKEPVDEYTIQSEEVTETPAATQTPEAEDSGREVTPSPESKPAEDDVAFLPQTGESDVLDEVREQESSKKEESTSYPRKLQRGELQAFTNWIDQEDNSGNYGLLLSEYTDPKDADLNQIFYTGAGMESEPLTDSEK